LAVISLLGLYNVEIDIGLFFLDIINHILATEHYIKWYPKLFYTSVTFLNVGELSAILPIPFLLTLKTTSFVVVNNKTDEK
jgi:hypothetical protein